jgi:hypothetical protein
VNLGSHYRRRYFLPVSLEAAAETFLEGLRGAEDSAEEALDSPEMSGRSASFELCGIHGAFLPGPEW